MEPAITEVTNRDKFEEKVLDQKGKDTTSAKKSVTKSTEKSTQPTGAENLERPEETRLEGDVSKETVEKKLEGKEANTAIEEERRVDEKEKETPSKEDTNLGKRPASKEITEPTDKEDRTEPALEKKVKGESGSVRKGVTDGEQPRETTAAEGQT